MQRDGLDQLMVFCSLSHQLWELREGLKKQREEGKSAFLAEAMLQIPKSQCTAQSETIASSKMRFKVGPQGRLCLGSLSGG